MPLSTFTIARTAPFTPDANADGSPAAHRGGRPAVGTHPGAAPAWAGAPWLTLTQVTGSGGGLTRAKLLWSTAGIHVLVECVDDLLNCTLDHDGANLFTEDCVEIFLQPEPAQDLYLEYELSPLGHHLVLLVPNARQGGFHGWTAWHDVGDRAVRRAVAVHGGPQASGAAITGWTAECLLPWDLFRGLHGIPAKPGAQWRGNVYRLDNDTTGRTSAWALEPATRGDFHDSANFAHLHFSG